MGQMQIQRDPADLKVILFQPSAQPMSRHFKSEWRMVGEMARGEARRRGGGSSSELWLEPVQCVVAGIVVEVNQAVR